MNRAGEDAAYASIESSNNVVNTVSDSFSTNAVSRGLSDLHTPTWFALLSLNVSLRTILFHPLNVAVSRKRVTREAKPPSVSTLIAQAYNGEVGKTSNSNNNNNNNTIKGIRGIYRGLGAALVGNLIGEVTYLHTLETVKEMIETSSSSSSSTNIQKENAELSRNYNINSYAVAVGGMAGDLAALFLITPIAVVCNRQMTAGYGMTINNKYQPAWKTAREVCQLYQISNNNCNNNYNSFLRKIHGAMRGLYAGLSPGIIGLPASGVWWAVYSEMKSGLYKITEPTLSRWETERKDNNNNNNNNNRPVWKQNWFLSPTDNPALNAISGMFASVMTALLFNPVDVLHTRLQAFSPGEFGNMKNNNNNNNNIPFARVRYIIGDLLRVEGWRGFFKGTVANMSVSVLNGVIFSLFFELAKLGSDREFLSKL